MIPCPKCKSTKSWVVDKRNKPNGEVHRRRQCDDCGRRFTTYECTCRPSQRRYAARNREAETARVRRWREENPEKVQRIRLREAARKEAKATGRPVKELYERFGCA